MNGVIRVYLRNFNEPNVKKATETIEIPYPEKLMDLLDEGYQILSTHPLTELPTAKPYDLDEEVTKLVEAFENLEDVPNEQCVNG